MSEQPSLELHQLPEEVSRLLQQLEVPPYLLAHLVLVHDTARRLTEAVQQRWPDLALDAELVHFGAAIHDLGKVTHPEEMSGPGKNHHQAGVDLLQQLGVEGERLRFARTHGAWQEHEDLVIEDLLVSLADVAWAGGRRQELEDQITQRLARVDGRELWETFMDLDDILIEITREGELRLVWQTQFAPQKEELEQGGEI